MHEWYQRDESKQLCSPFTLPFFQFRGHESFLQSLEGLAEGGGLLSGSFDVHQELADLEAKENQIDTFLLEAQQRVRSMEQDADNKYVTRHRPLVT